MCGDFGFKAVWICADKDCSGSPSCPCVKRFNLSCMWIVLAYTDNSFAGVGEAAEMNDIIVSLKDVSESHGSTFNKPADGNVFVICEFEITNNSDKEINISSMLSFEAYCDDYACTFSLSALLEKQNKNQLDGTVAPRKKFNGIVGYEVPSDWKNMEIHFTPDFWSNKDFIFVAEK